MTELVVIALTAGLAALTAVVASRPIPPALVPVRIKRRRD